MNSEQNSLYNFCNFFASLKLFQNKRVLLGEKNGRSDVKYTYKIENSPSIHGLKGEEVDSRRILENEST